MKAVVENAQEEWKKVNRDKEAVEKFHMLGTGEKEFVRYDENGYELSTTNLSNTPLIWHDVKTYKKCTEVQTHSETRRHITRR